MQNSGLAATLGKRYFSPLTALPGALFSVRHKIADSLLAGYRPGKAVATQCTVARGIPLSFSQPRPRAK